MAALTINGIDVPVGSDGWRDGLIEVADRGRALSGAYLGTRRAGSAKRTFGGRLVTADAAEAEALRSVINGDGYGFSFASDCRDDWKGNTGFVDSDATREAGGKFSAGQMSIATAATATFTWPTGWPTSRWTCSLWTYESAAWHHYVKIYGTTTVWLDGSAGTALPAWMTFNSTGLTLGGDAGAARKYSEIVIWPFFAPTTWPALLAARTTAMTKPPFFAAAGDYVVQEGTTQYVCRGQALATEATNRGSLARLQRVPFSLEEA